MRDKEKQKHREGGEDRSRQGAFFTFLRRKRKDKMKGIKVTKKDNIRTFLSV